MSQTKPQEFSLCRVSLAGASLLNGAVAAIMAAAAVERIKGRQGAGAGILMTVSTWCWKTASRQLSRLEAAMLTTTTTTVQMNQVPGGQNNRSIWTERQEEPAPPIVTCAAFPPVRVAPVAMIPCLGWIIFPSSRPSPPAMREPAYATRECSPHSIGRNPKMCTEGDRWMNKSYT